MTKVLEFENVYAGYAKASILYDVTLSVRKGDSLGILGRNGVGKTTLVNCLYGLARIQNGSIALKGHHINRFKPYMPSQYGVALVPQGRRIIPGLTVRETLQLGAGVKRVGEWGLQTVFQLFPALEEKKNAQAISLSGGQQQMLAIGRALMANPEILILDEPSEGLAPIIVDEVGKILTRLVKDGITIILVEQNANLLKRVTHQYILMSKGSIEKSGMTSNVDISSLLG